MEPLTALAVATSVVQFADFGVRLLNEAAQVYQSADGQTSQSVHLATIARDLNELSSDVEAKSTALIRSGRHLNPTEQILLRLCRECRGICAQLDEALGRLRTGKKSSGGLNFAMESFAVALRSVWERERILGLRGKLSDVRQQMMMASLAVLW